MSDEPTMLPRRLRHHAHRPDHADTNGSLAHVVNPAAFLLEQIFIQAGRFSASC